MKPLTEADMRAALDQSPKSTWSPLSLKISKEPSTALSSRFENAPENRQGHECGYKPTADNTPVERDCHEGAPGSPIG